MRYFAKTKHLHERLTNMVFPHPKPLTQEVIDRANEKFLMNKVLENMQEQEVIIRMNSHSTTKKEKRELEKILHFNDLLRIKIENEGKNNG